MAKPRKEIIDNKDGTYGVLSSDKKKYYTASPDKCECTGFRFHNTCRHVRLVQKMAGKKTADLKFEKYEYDFLEFIDRFGAENYEKWLNEGVIMRSGGKVRVV